MGDGIEKMSQDCYNFQGLRDLFKKTKSHSVKRNPNHKNNHVLSHDHKIKPSYEGHDPDIVKANHMIRVKQLGLKSNGVNELKKPYSKHDNNHKSCFRAIILLSTSKKKQIQSKVSASDLPDDASTRLTESIMSKSGSFDKTSSLGRSRSINNSRSENWVKSPTKSRVPTLNRTLSTGSTTTSFNGRSSVNRSTSNGRSSTNDSVTSSRKANMFRSGPLIMFSNSSGVLKPPAMEQQLECTLDELCHGCVKHIKVYRDVYSFTGQIVQREEVLKVNVKPGWRTGTKITFQGATNNEKPGEFPADIVFTITEKHHPLFLRNEDDLELEIEIPLVDALTGCNLTIPLLGKEKMSVAFDDIVYPGLEKIIVGQGMPNQKNPDYKGDLKVKFLVEFPKSLTDEQRYEIFTILSS